MIKVFLLLPFFLSPCFVQARIELISAEEICIHVPDLFFSSPTDYFRSVQNGDWGTLSTWESSPDNATWAAATLIPNSTANTICIKTGHTVTVTSNQDMDQVVIESGGVINYTGGILTINDGAGDDITINTGGIFRLAFNSNPPLFSPLTANVTITQGGILRVSAGGMTGNGTGVNASNYNYLSGSILELTVVYSTNTVTYFPNATAAVIPIFRSSTLLNVGAAGNTTFNGLFEAALSLNIDGSGQKIFRNGITGAGNINGSASGKFVINGTTAELGGGGSLTLPTSGMDVGAATTVTMVSAKTVTGNVALLANSFINLGNFNLTLAGDVTGGSLTSHIVSNGLGKLILNNIGAATRDFPVGASTLTYNPVNITNGGGFNYGVRVEVGINPAIVVPLNAVNRTWFVTPNGGTPGSVDINFFYAAGEANAGFNYAANLELGQYTGVWNVIQTGLVPGGSYQVATTVNTLGDNIEAPLVLANLGAILTVNDAVSVNYFSGIKQNGNHLLKWKLTCNSTAAVTMVVQRSADGINFDAIFTEHATALRCQQPFIYNDDKPAAGVNYYRIKMIDTDGKIYYSTIVSLINTFVAIDILNISPNPITGNNFNLKVSAAKGQKASIIITDIQKKILQHNPIDLIAGFNIIPINITGLPTGTYYVFVKTPHGPRKILRFVLL